MSENGKNTQGTELTPEELEMITGGIYHGVIPPCGNCKSSGQPILDEITKRYVCATCGAPREGALPGVQVVY